MTFVSLFLSVLFASNSLAADDLNQPQSPPRPRPEGMTFIDQGTRDPRLKGYRTPDGFQLEIVATEPTIINPVGMTFGPDGTLFVLEWRLDTDTWPETPEKITYKDGTTRLVATMKKKVKDVVKVLTWNAEKKVFDQARVILEDELPSSILIHDGWLYLSGRGTVRRWKLTDIIEGKNLAAKPEVIAQGFCGFHHHQVSGLTIGLDGWLYITSGDDDNIVEGSDGSRATVLRTGAIFRCRPDGSKMHVFSIGYRNPYRDAVQDSFGNWFHADNDNEDGSKFTGCRLMHVAEESDFGWRLYPGSRCCKPDPVRGAVMGELPGKLPAMLKTGRGAPAGLLCYDDTQLPEFYRGWLWYPDVFRRSIRTYSTKQDGSTFKVDREFEFLTAADPLFRPCQMLTGPDGAIYICDWRTDSGGAGKLFGDGIHGRIYRVSWTGGQVPGLEEKVPAIPLRPRDSWAKLLPILGERGSFDSLIEAERSPDLTMRVRAQHEVLHRIIPASEVKAKGGAYYNDADTVRGFILSIAEDADSPIDTRLVSMGALNSLWNEKVQKAFIGLLQDKSPDIRRAATDGLALNSKPGDAMIQTELEKNLGDVDLTVRRATALAIGKINAEGAAELLIGAYRFDDGKDIFLTDGYLRALERCGKAGIAAVLDLAKSGDDNDRDKAVTAFTSFRTRDAASAVTELLADPHLVLEQKVALIKSYTNYQFETPVSLEPLIDFLLSRPQEPQTVQSAIMDTLALTGNLKGAKVVNVLTNLLDSENADARLAAIRSIETARFSEATPRLAQSLGDKKRSAAERIAILKALRVLNDKRSVEVLKNLFDAPEPRELRIEAIRTLAAVDSVSAQPIAVALLDQPDAGMQSEAVQILGSRPEGAKLVGQRFLDQKLPRDLLPQVAEALRKHAGQDPLFAKMLTDVMRGGLLLSLDASQVEKVREMVAKQGNPQRGKAIYLSSKSLNCVLCHKLEGVGGQVGPDLSKIWETGTIEKIMEAIIDPSKEIKEGFQSFRLTTKNGQTHTGLKVVDQPKEVVLRDANGKDIRIAREEIDELVASKISLMPENAVAQLSLEQFLDLVAFLKDRKMQESLRGMVTEFLVAGPFSNELTAHETPEEKPQEATWQKRTTAPNGYLDLRAVFDKDRISAYALVYLYSPKTAPATLHIGGDDTLRVWVNDKQVYEQTTPKTAVPDDRSVKVDLKEGWNPVLIKVVNRLDAHGIYLRFEGEGLRFSIDGK